MKCIHCERQWGNNSIPIVCVRCVEKMRQLDEEDHVVANEEPNEDIHKEGG